MKINIFNESNRWRINKKEIVNFIKKILNAEGFKLNNLNIVITNNNYLKKLNKMFFKKNQPTNVISFDMQEVSEIYVSCDNVANIKELYYYIIHGLLHITGHDHKNKMKEKLMEEKCLKYLEYVSVNDSKT